MAQWLWGSESAPITSCLDQVYKAASLYQVYKDSGASTDAKQVQLCVYMCCVILPWHAEATHREQATLSPDRCLLV